MLNGQFLGVSLRVGLYVAIFLRRAKRISTSIPNAKVLSGFIFYVVFGRFPAGRALRCNLFAKGKKDFHFNP